MTPEEFIQACVQSGYAGKPKAEDYVNENPKDEYTIEDFEKVHTFMSVTHRNPLAKGFVEHGKKTTNSGFRS